jgi:P27 family predicted phage terminase small subunit
MRARRAVLGARYRRLPGRGVQIPTAASPASVHGSQCAPPQCFRSGYDRAVSNPKPPKLKLLQGNAGHRPISEAPSVPPAIPKPPKYLSAAARREWRRIGPLLKANGLISHADREMFARWCQTVAKIAEYEQQLAKEPVTLVAQSGYKMPHPLHALIASLSKQLVGLSDRFGLNPRARAVARVELEPERDEFDAFLERGGGCDPLPIVNPLRRRPRGKVD